ncbi:hypothetical protein, partial [Pseudomonas aeruginosa]|uniref:hypothetical protein n=1 Tax=Pseudomonas aeruginosa TaxID=287 RepID=UPI001E4A936B
VEIKRGISFVFIISKEHSAQYKGRRKRRKWRVSVGRGDFGYLNVGPRQRSAAGHGAALCRLAAGALPGLRFAQPVVNLFTSLAETAGVAASTSLRRSRKAGAARMDAG